MATPRVVAASVPVQKHRGVTKGGAGHTRQTHEHNTLLTNHLKTNHTHRVTTPEPRKHTRRATNHGTPHSTQPIKHGTCTSISTSLSPLPCGPSTSLVGQVKNDRKLYVTPISFPLIVSPSGVGYQ